jgi:hypothetical protein
MKTIQIKVKQPAVEHTTEVSVPCYRKRGNWYYGVLSETEAIQVFKSEYTNVGAYICTGERMVSDAFDTGTEESTRSEFLEALSWSIAGINAITRDMKEDNQ